MVTRESIYYINLRQAYLLSPLYAHRISSRTVLFSSVPDAYTSEAKIRQMFGRKLKNVWVVTKTDDLEKKVEERNKVAIKLEAAETKLIKAAHDAREKGLKKGVQDSEGGAAHADVSGESGSAAARWIQPKNRPTHKLKFLIGKKVDTINWCRSELQRLIPEVEKEQNLHRSGDTTATNTVIVEFYNQTEAQAAFQMVAHHQPLHMTPRTIGFVPEEIVWSNTGITWRTRVVRNIISIAVVVVTIVFWYVSTRNTPINLHYTTLIFFSLNVLTGLTQVHSGSCCWSDIQHQLPDREDTVPQIHQLYSPGHPRRCHRPASNHHARSSHGSAAHLATISCKVFWQADPVTD